MRTYKHQEYIYASLADAFIAGFGKNPNISAGYYNGTKKSLNQSHEDKHDWVLKGLNFERGDKILDIGSGEGPMLKAVQDRGGIGIGLALSQDQVTRCKNQGLDARFHSWDDEKTSELGKFKGIIAIESFAYFCTRQDYLAGNRDRIYTNFFKTCHDLLEENSRLFLQLWTYGKNIPWGSKDPTKNDFEKISFDSPDPKYRVLAGMDTFIQNFSLPPHGTEYLKFLATPYFNPIESNDGRLDYVKTIIENQKALTAKTFKNLIAQAKTWRYYLYDFNRHSRRMRARKRFF